MWAKKATRQPGMTGVLLGAYVVLLATLAEGMARTLLHPGSLFHATHGDDADARASVSALQRGWPPFGLAAYGRFTTM